MTVPTNTYETFAQIGTKEDISPVIARIDPEETPFYSNARKTSAKQKTNQWQTQALAAAAANSAIEGDDTASAAATPTVLLNNVQNIAKKVFQTSGSNSAQEAYGRSNEHTYQRLLKGVELRRDIEVTLLADTAKVAGSSGTARVCAGVPTWLTNTSHGTGGSAATGNGTNTTTNGTDRAFTLAQLKTVMTACRNDGGKPSMLMLSPGQKVNFSSFTGIADGCGGHQDLHPRRRCRGVPCPQNASRARYARHKRHPGKRVGRLAGPGGCRGRAHPDDCLERLETKRQN